MQMADRWWMRQPPPEPLDGKDHPLTVDLIRLDENGEEKVESWELIRKKWDGENWGDVTVKKPDGTEVSTKMGAEAGLTEEQIKAVEWVSKIKKEVSHILIDGTRD